MKGQDLMLSINCALYEEQINAYKRGEIFNRDDVTIMATAKAINMITPTDMPYIDYYVDGQTKCLGCKLKMVDGEDAEIYLARKIPILSEKLSEEGAE